MRIERIEDVSEGLQRQIILRHMHKISARGGKAGSRAAKRLQALRTAKRAWRVRRLRYGPTGRRPVDVRLRARLEGGDPGAWKKAEPCPHTEGVGVGTSG